MPSALPFVISPLVPPRRHWLVRGIARTLATLARPFTFDLRALALLRIAVAALVLLDLAIRATDLEAHYSNAGVLPVAALYDHVWNPYQFSLHAASGLWQGQALLFALAAAAAGALLLGYRSRLATGLSWLLLLSVQNRNPMLGQGGDDLLRMLLFWGVFLPWGRAWAVDARSGCHLARQGYCSAATVAYVVQLALLYWCSALLKTGPEWTEQGTALYYALSLDQLVLPAGKLLYPYPELLKNLTFGTWYLELLAPFLLFIPVGVRGVRLAFLVLTAGFHLGVSLTLFVGLFFLIATLAGLALLPANVLDWLEQQAWALRRRWAAHSPLARPLPGWMRLPRHFRPRHHSWPNPGGRRLLRGMREACVSTLLLYVCWWNLDGIATSPRWLMSEPLRWLGYLFRTDQHWGMFAPTVFKDDGWYLLEGSTVDGRLLDLGRAGQPVAYAKPASVVSMFKNDRWRKYSENYLFIANEWMRPYYCQYLLRQWRENPARPPLRQLTVVYMKEISQPDYHVAVPTREVLCNCQ